LTKKNLAAREEYKKLKARLDTELVNQEITSIIHRQILLNAWYSTLCEGERRQFARGGLHAPTWARVPLSENEQWREAVAREVVIFAISEFISGGLAGPLLGRLRQAGNWLRPLDDAAAIAARNKVPRSITDTPDVKATFDHAGRGTFEDVNPTARNPLYRTDEGIPTGSSKGPRPYNNNTADMHAEIGAMYQSYAAGHRGGKAVLKIEGLHACTQCRGDIKKMARLMELDELTVITPEGTFNFRGPQDFLPVKEGGKPWQ
jgi:hypothetical protein